MGISRSRYGTTFVKACFSDHTRKCVHDIDLLRSRENTRIQHQDPRIGMQIAPNSNSSNGEKKMRIKNKLIQFAMLLLITAAIIPQALGRVRTRPPAQKAGCTP